MPDTDTEYADALVERAAELTRALHRAADEIAACAAVIQDAEAKALALRWAAAARDVAEGRRNA